MKRFAPYGNLRNAAVPVTMPLWNVGMNEKRRRKLPASRLSLQQRFDFGCHLLFIDDPKPAPDDLAIGIDQHVLRLRGDIQLSSDVV